MVRLTSLVRSYAALASGYPVRYLVGIGCCDIRDTGVIMMASYSTHKAGRHWLTYTRDLSVRFDESQHSDTDSVVQRY